MSRELLYVAKEWTQNEDALNALTVRDRVGAWRAGAPRPRRVVDGGTDSAAAVSSPTATSVAPYICCLPCISLVSPYLSHCSAVPHHVLNLSQTFETIYPSQ